MNSKKSNKILLIGIIAVVLAGAFILIGAVGKLVKDGGKPKTLAELVAGVNVTNATPKKGSVTMGGDNSLYDELPDIDKYPLSVEGRGDIDIEIFASGEKAGKGYESWLIDTAEAFNKKGADVNGKTVSVSVRPMSSGQGGDYIISGKYIPDLYSPSNELFGNYVMANGGDVELYQQRFLGNTAGLLVKKSFKYKNIKEVAQAVSKGEVNLGYTNPQTSATGLNLLMALLHEYDKKNPTSQKAAGEFAAFQANIPYVAYTTMQMRDSASNGSLDAMVMEYQTYSNESGMKNEYDFIPFGVRHDSPLYKATGLDSEKNQAIDLFYQFAMSDKMQANAKDKGFNANDDYQSDLSFTGSDVTDALKLYKANKDSGRDIIAVFVADCSGSMDGEPMLQLKESLSNGMQYINENNYVGLVSYSSDVTIELPINKFDMTQKSYFQGAVDSMIASGGTSSYEAVTVAIDMVKKAQADHPDAKAIIFLLSDGYANGDYKISTIKNVVQEEKIPIYTIGYTSEADMDSLKELSDINEAACINTDSEDIVYKIKSLFNSSL